MDVLPPFVRLRSPGVAPTGGHYSRGVTEPQVPGARVRRRRGGSVWQVTADRLHDLQQLAVVAIGEPAVTDVDVEVRRWRPPRSGWLGSPRLAGLSGMAIEPTRGGVQARVSLVEPTDPGLVLAGLVRLLRPVPRDEGPAITAAPGLPPQAAALAGVLRDAVLPGERRDAHVRRADVLLTGDGADAPAVECAVSVEVRGDGWRRDGQPVDVCVDPTVHRPTGRRSVVEGIVATATSSGERVHLVGPGTRIQVDGSLTAAQVSALRGVDAVVGTMTDAVARQLNACGILTAATEAGLPDPADPLAWQAASVHERRHALRQYGPTLAVGVWPTVSVVLVTHRPDHLEHAMSQLARLDYPHLEVVIGAHGDRVDGARVWELAQDLPHAATIVGIEGRWTLGQALQECSDRAQGALLTKMDDDDHYGPEHIWDLVLARQYSGAEVVGKALDWIHVESADVTAFRPVYAAEKYATFVAGGTILIARGDLAAVGGWRPVPKSVDRALLDRVLADGGLVYRTHGLGYVYVRRGEGHTADVRDEHFLTKTAATVPGLVRHACFGTEAPA